MRDTATVIHREADGGVENNRETASEPLFEYFHSLFTHIVDSLVGDGYLALPSRLIVPLAFAFAGRGTRFVCLETRRVRINECNCLIRGGYTCLRLACGRPSEYIVTRDRRRDPEQKG
jgi:hypothetical protein